MLVALASAACTGKPSGSPPSGASASPSDPASSGVVLELDACKRETTEPVEIKDVEVAPYPDVVILADGRRTPPEVYWPCDQSKLSAVVDWT